MAYAAQEDDSIAAGEASIAALLDPVALEARLVDARARRARAIAARDATRAVPPEAEPHAEPVAAPAAIPTPPQPAAAPTWFRPAYPVFLSGLAIGAAATVATALVMLDPALIAPTLTHAPAPSAPPAPATVDAAAPRATRHRRPAPRHAPDPDPRRAAARSFGSRP